jgi:hypothetical protein
MDAARVKIAQWEKHQGRQLVPGAVYTKICPKPQAALSNIGEAVQLVEIGWVLKHVCQACLQFPRLVHEFAVPVTVGVFFATHFTQRFFAVA